MLPVVALVGRPNVGKSTLFNYLTKKYDALVANAPGVTRDRQYGYATIAGYKFMIIDTGGFDIIDVKTGLQQYINEQSKLAIQEANIIFFIVDAQKHVIPLDQEIAKYLRLFNKKIILVVNKIDGLHTETAIIDFYRLGFKDIYPISAAHSRGISNLLKKVLLPWILQFSETIKKTDISKYSNHYFVNLLEEKKKYPFDNPIKLTVVGRPNVGKSTLVNRLLGENRVIVYDLPGTTRDSINIPMIYQNREYLLIDTAGARKHSKIKDKIEKLSVLKTMQSIEQSNVVILLVDVNMGIADQDLSLLNFILKNGRALIIVINKWDKLLNTNMQKTMKHLINNRLNFIKFINIHFVSVLYDNDIVDNIMKSVNQAYEASIKYLTTSILTRIMKNAVIEHQPPLIHGHQIKLKYAHAGGYNPPIIIIHGNRIKKISLSYKKYLINYFRNALHLSGTPLHIHFKEGKNPYI